MAAPPSPRPMSAKSDSGDALLALFLDTDLGTRFAMLVDPGTTFRRLKSQVALEHATAFPDVGPVAVKSFQVYRKGALYHLSDSMTVTSAFTRVKGGCFLHVKMVVTAVATRCCQSIPEIDGKRTSEGHVGIHAEKHVRELASVTPEVANDALTHVFGGVDATAVLNNVAHDTVPDDALLPSSSQLDTETKNEAQGLASDADIDLLSKQTNISHVVQGDGKENFLHGDCVDGDVCENKQMRINEDILTQTHADDISQGKKFKKAKRTDSVHMSATRITNESDITDTDKSMRSPLKINPTHEEHSNTSFGQEVNDNIPRDSIRIKPPRTVGKNKKRKSSQLASSEIVCGKEAIKLPTGAVELSNSGTDDMTNRGGSKAISSVLLLSSEPNDECQGGEHVQFVNNAQTYTDLTSEQGNSDHMHNGDRNPSIGDAINSTAEVPPSGETIAEGSNGPWGGGEKHEETKKDKYNESSHGVDLAKTNMEKGVKNIDALEERPTNDNISKEKKRKKVKKVKSVEMASMDTAVDKEIIGHAENAEKLNKDYTEREILHGPSVGFIPDNVQQENSNVTENPNGDGKRKKRKRRLSESVKDANPNQDQTKSSEHVTYDSSIHHTNSAPLDAKQTAQGNVEGATGSENTKFGESLDIAAAINEVLADLKASDSLSEGLNDDLSRQIHLESNADALGLPAFTDNKIGNEALKYPEAIHSDAPARSPSHKKPKGKKLNKLAAMVDSSHHSFRMPEEEADTKSKESDTKLKASDLKDVFTGDVVEQDDGKTKSTKRQRKKVKKVSTDKTVQSLDEQVNPVAREDMEGVNASIQTDLVQGSVIDTPMETVAKVQQKDKKGFKTRAPKIQEANHSTHAAKDSQDKNAIGVTGTHDNENASGYPTVSTVSPVVTKDCTTLKSSSPDARKAMNKPSKTELQSQDWVSPKNSADAVEANRCVVSHTVSDKIDFMNHFSSGKMNDQLVSAENIQNNEDEILEAKNKKNNPGSTEPNDLESLSAEKTSLTGHFGTSEVVVPSAKAGNMNREYVTVSSKEKRKKKRKTNSEGPSADKENLDGDHQSTATQNSLHSAVRNGGMGQDNGNENNNKVTKDVSIRQLEPEYVAVDRIIEKKPRQHDTDNQNSLPTNKDNAKISKELRKSTSQKNAHASNLVKSFALSPAASSDSTEGTQQIGNRFRLAVRKVPKERYEQANAKSRKETRKLGPRAILFSGAISEESDDAMDTKGDKDALETSLDNSSAPNNSGISSAAYDESDVPDDDEALSLSQKSLRGGLQIGSILRGSSSYKKAKQKQAELLDDDTEVPDSQPADDL